MAEDGDVAIARLWYDPAEARPNGDFAADAGVPQIQAAAQRRLRNWKDAASRRSSEGDATISAA